MKRRTWLQFMAGGFGVVKATRAGVTEPPTPKRSKQIQEPTVTEDIWGVVDVTTHSTHGFRRYLPVRISQ